MALPLPDFAISSNYSHHNDIIVFGAVRDPGGSWVIVFASNCFSLHVVFPLLA